MVDDARFDGLARTLGGGQTRRGTLGAIAGLLGGGLVSLLPDGETEAKKRKKKCKGGTKRCGKKCYDLNTDPANCGSCGNVCGANQTCGGGNPGTPGVCGCTKTTCAAQGKNCGEIPDGCGGTLDCGICQSDDDLCGGGGTPNVCGCLANGVVTTLANRDACCSSSCCFVSAGMCECAGGCG